MTKLWSKPRRIEIYQRNTQRKVAEFVADDACSRSPINIFYLNGKEVCWYNEQKCYYKSFELE